MDSTHPSKWGVVVGVRWLGDVRVRDRVKISDLERVTGGRQDPGIFKSKWELKLSVKTLAE
jgi:hypothetical protein